MCYGQSAMCESVIAPPKQRSTSKAQPAAEKLSLRKESHDVAHQPRTMVRAKNALCVRIALEEQKLFWFGTAIVLISHAR